MADIADMLLDERPDWAKEGQEKTLLERLEEKDARFKTSVKHGIQQNPDTAAKDQANAKKLNISPDIAKRKSTEVDELVRAKEINDLTTESPLIRRMFEDPKIAEVIHDDVKELSALEMAAESLSAFGQSVAVGTGGLSRGILRWPEMFGRAADFLTELPGISHVNEMLGLHDLGEDLGINAEGTFTEAIMGGIEIGDTTYGPSQAAERNARISAELFPVIDEYNQIADQAFDDALEGDFNGMQNVLTDPRMLAAFVGQAIPSLVVMAMTGGSLKVIAAMEAMEVTEDAAEFEKMTGTRVDPNQYMAAMAQVATLNTVFEKFGFSKIVGSKGVLSTLLAGVSEMGTEMSQAFNTNLAIWWAYNKDKSLTGGVLPGGLGGFGAGVGGGTLNSLGQASDADSSYGQDVVRATNAITFSDAIGDVVTAARETKTSERQPALVGMLLEDKFGKGDEANIVIPFKEASVLFQEDAAALEALPEDTKEQVIEALDNEGDVVVSKAEYVTTLSEHHEELAPVIRNDMDGMNAAEAEAWFDNDQNQAVLESADKIIAKAETTSEFVQSADRVAANIKQQLINVGMSKQHADVQSKFHRAFAISVATKLNKDFGVADHTLPEAVTKDLKIQRGKITRNPDGTVNIEALKGTGHLDGIMMDEVDVEMDNGEFKGITMPAELAFDKAKEKTDALQKLQDCING